MVPEERPDRVAAAQSAEAAFDEYAVEKPFFYAHYALPSIVQRAASGRAGHFIEIGAGDGQKLRAGIDRGAFMTFETFTAFDISPERVRRIAALVPEARAEVADAQRLPLADESADFVFSDQVIEHVPDDAAMAREVFRVLKPTGAAVIGSVIKGKGAWYFHRNGGEWRIDETHVREYASAREFERVFQNAGLVVSDVDVFPIRFPLDEVALRVATRLRLLDARRASKAAESSRALRWLSRTSIAIPRYYYVYALCLKSSERGILVAPRR
jgi:SAM-dependent methyltransferase